MKILGVNNPNNPKVVRIEIEPLDGFTIIRNYRVYSISDSIRLYISTHGKYVDLKIENEENYDRHPISNYEYDKIYDFLSNPLKQILLQTIPEAEPMQPAKKCIQRRIAINAIMELEV